MVCNLSRADIAFTVVQGFSTYHWKFKDFSLKGNFQGVYVLKTFICQMISKNYSHLLFVILVA